MRVSPEGHPLCFVDERLSCILAISNCITHCDSERQYQCVRGDLLK